METFIAVTQSSNIRGLAWAGESAESGALCVAFANGTYYAYPEVPRAVAEAVATAPSVGKAFNAEIRSAGRKATKLDAPPEYAAELVTRLAQVTP